MTLDVLGQAERDLAEIFDWQLDQSEDRAWAFDAAIHAAFAQLLKHPFSAPDFRGIARRLVIAEWGYGIYYSVHGTRIVIRCVQHLSRDDTTILRILGEA